MRLNLVFEEKDEPDSELLACPRILWLKQDAVDRVDRNLQHTKSERGKRYGK